MEKKENPFKLKGYHGAKLFCDREDETESLISKATSGINTTLFSIRRMGKTGLIHHTFRQLEKDKNWVGIYIDIYATQNLTEFTNQVATSILKTFPEQNSIGKQFLELLKGFSPVISYDSFTGKPEVTLTFNSDQQKKHTIGHLFDFLESQKKRIIIAIDEFQQITTYPETNTEAILRTYIQHMQKTSFIFSGSHKHMLIEMFSSAKRPFFSSTFPLHLHSIPEKKYSSFIKKLFKQSQKNIDANSIDFILQWSRRHTFYTQALCHKVFQLSDDTIHINLVYQACDAILKEQEPIYFQYRNLLTKGQWLLLRAIAREDKVFHPTSGRFVGTHSLGNPASVLKSLHSLIEKEMVVEDNDKDGNKYYQVYDCFLSRWLARKH